MSLIKVLVTDRYTSEALAQLQSQLNCEIQRSASHYPTADELHNCQALLTRSATVVDEKLLRRANQLKLIVSATSGVDHIDLKLCEERGIAVGHSEGANTESAAETTLLLTLQCLRRQRETQMLFDKKHWKNKMTLGQELRGKDFGILGLGRVGSRVAELVTAFGAKVYACDPYVEDQKFQRLGVERMGMSELLRQVQILSLHVNLTPETKHMINGHNLCQLPTDGILINTSRGAVVNEGDLTVALEQNVIAGCGLDVFEVEPLPAHSRLRELPQAVLSPHLGAFTAQAFGRASDLAVQKVINFFTK